MSLRSKCLGLVCKALSRKLLYDLVPMRVGDCYAQRAKETQ